jgi:hypothetical protein
MPAKPTNSALKMVVFLVLALPISNIPSFLESQPVAAYVFRVF